MAQEIERKFLVKNDKWMDDVLSRSAIRQGYLASQKNATVRVRIAGEAAFITVKGATRGIARAEFEYPIPTTEAWEMLSQVAEQPFIDKTRYRVRCAGHVWDLDVFAGANQGLVVAEVELVSESEAFQLPEWAGDEVSDDPRYFNANLVTHPYRDW
ncbi:MAG: CYTH domain-containing protein [Candidatus Sedimenticola endophacoides]